MTETEGPPGVVVVGAGGVSVGLSYGILHTASGQVEV